MGRTPDGACAAPHLLSPRGFDQTQASSKWIGLRLLKISSQGHGRKRIEVQSLWKYSSSILVVLSLCLSFLARGQDSSVVLPEAVPDPIEPVNRVMWGVNKGLMADVIKPTSRVYRSVVAKPIRTGIGDFGTNLTYPVRLINNLLQGRWAGARDESYRFICNTTVGWGGFFNAADKWKIPKSPADFGQTLGQWGWKPHCFLMLPLFGPSNERDTLGLAVDTASNPLLYISPYKFDAGNPLTYLGPYTYFTYAVMYNDLSDTVDDYVRFSKAEMDPYADIEYSWKFIRENRVANFQVKGKKAGRSFSGNPRIGLLHVQGP